MTSLALGLLAGLELALVAGAAVLVLRSRSRLRELERRRALVGRLLQVNTPKPDDQTIRGVCIAELDGGGLLLEGAVLIYRVTVRGGLEEDREQPLGTVTVPRYSFAQIVAAGALGPAAGEVDEAPAAIRAA